MTNKPKFRLIESNTQSPKMLLHVPQEGDMNYLFLSLYQARHLRDQLDSALKRVNYHNDNSSESDIDDIVVSFPKKEK